MSNDCNIILKKSYNKAYRENNIDKIKEREKIFRDKNRDVINEKARLYATKVRAEKGDVYYKLLERKRSDSIKYRLENLDAVKLFYENNKKRINEKRRIKYSLTKMNIKKIEYSEWQLIKKRESRRKSAKKIRLEGRISEFSKFKASIRKRTCYAFNRLKMNKPYNTEKLLGLNMNELKTYIENKFKDGMSWDNRKDWHIDHILPLSSAKTEEEMIKLCHYANLQPLWAKENMSKGSKILINI